MKSRRSYTQRARATEAAATRQRIIEAATALMMQHFRADIRLEDIAAQANVSVQTIMRVFGSRAALVDEAGAALQRHIEVQRNQAAPGDIAGAISGLFDHYEEVGDIVIRNLAQETDPAVQPGIVIGRNRHRQWVEEHFAPQLARHAPPQQSQLVDALVCVCDVYTWKLLRRDLGRTRDAAEATMIWMVSRLLEDV